MTISTTQFTIINTGTVANDGNGDSLRAAFNKINTNFTNIGATGFNAANIVASGTVQADTFVGDGSQLTGLVLAPAATAVTVTANAQANITSVGALTSLTVSGNIVAGNVSGTNLTGHITTGTQSAITSVGTLTSLAVSGNITTSNISVTGYLTTSNPRTYKFSQEAAAGNISSRELDFSLSGDDMVFVQINSNLAITYGATIHGGRRIDLAVFNANVGDFYINLPNNNTTTGSAAILVSGSKGARLTFASYGTTSANVIVAVNN
jgi:hypothetical protein